MQGRESSRTRILRSADRLFSEHGYDVVTVDQICADSNSAKGSFYHFFRSKEDLAVQLLDDVWQGIVKAMDKTFAPDRAPLVQIRDELHRVYSSARSTRERSGLVTGCPMAFLAMTLGARSEKIRKRTTFFYNHMRQFYVSAFEQAQASGSMKRDRSPDELADAMLALVQGLHLLGRTFNSPTRVRRMSAAAYRILID